MRAETLNAPRGALTLSAPERTEVGKKLGEDSLVGHEDCIGGQPLEMDRLPMVAIKRIDRSDEEPRIDKIEPHYFVAVRGRR